jgi:8-oxo-dGTP pyrophosphatase MutT (NUDIX family)
VFSVRYPPDVLTLDERRVSTHNMWRRTQVTGTACTHALRSAAWDDPCNTAPMRKQQKVKTLSAGVVPLRPAPDGAQVLLLRAWNHWDFPKGGVEGGESPLQAAVREVEEETSITDLQFPWGEAFIDTGPYGNGKVSRYYVALTHETRVSLPVNPELGRPEHHEFRWCDPAQAARLVTPRVLEALQWALATATPWPA